MEKREKDIYTNRLDGKCPFFLVFWGGAKHQSEEIFQGGEESYLFDRFGVRQGVRPFEMIGG